jgi:hypothetical protein
MSYVAGLGRDGALGKSCERLALARLLSTLPRETLVLQLQIIEYV